MGRIPDEDVQKVRDATDLAALVAETVVLRKKGRLLWGNCPFHQEKTPSFKVDPATQLWHCFGCGSGGDAFGFLMRAERMDFPDAVRQLAERARVEIREEGGSGMPSGERDRLRAACESATAFYHRVLVTSKQPGATSARSYLAARGFDIEVAKRFGLGWAPGSSALVSHLREAGFSDEEMLKANLALPEDRSGRLRLKDRFRERVIFPIRDVTGKCVGFGGRVVGDGQPKYLNTGETPLFHKSRNLYAIDVARNEIVASREALVVEGYTDVIALHEAGLRNTVATLGTALTREHTKLLGRFTQRVVYLFDGDEAGVRAAVRAADLVDWHEYSAAGGGHVEMAVALVPEGKDPADWVREHGGDGVRRVLESAVPLLGFVIERRLAEHDLGTPEGRSAALAAAAGALAAVRGSMLEHEYTKVVSDRLLVEPSTVKVAVAGARPSIGLAAQASEAGQDDDVKVVLPESFHERELVRLLACEPSLRSRVGSIAHDDVVTSPVLASALRAIVASGVLVGAKLVDHVRRADPVAADMVAGLLVSDSPATGRIDSTFREVMTTLKVGALERRVIELRARMRSMDTERERAEYDRLFSEAAGVQRELHELRRCGVGTEQDQET